MTNHADLGVDRRSFLAFCSVAGVGHPVFAEALWRKAEAAGLPPTGSPGQGIVVTKDMVTAAAAMIGLEFSDAEKDELVQTLGGTLGLVVQSRTFTLPNSVGPAIRFDPELPGKAVKSTPRPIK